MRKPLNLILSLTLSSAALFLYGCEHKDKAPQPKEATEQNAPKENVSYDPNIGITKNGSFIKGTVSTKKSNGEDVSFDFNHEYITGASTYDEQTLSLYTYASLNDFINWTGASGIKMTTNDLSSKQVQEAYMELTASHILTDSKVFRFGTHEIPVNITDFTYDPETSIATGNFSVTTSETTNGQEAAITGTFKFTNIRENIYRKGQ